MWPYFKIFIYGYIVLNSVYQIFIKKEDAKQYLKKNIFWILLAGLLLVENMVKII